MPYTVLIINSVGGYVRFYVHVICIFIIAIYSDVFLQFRSHMYTGTSLFVRTRNGTSPEVHVRVIRRWFVVRNVSSSNSHGKFYG